MAINGIELEVGQEWLTRGGQTVQVRAIESDPDAEWPVLVKLNRVNHYTVTHEGYALAPDCPRDADLVRPVNLGIDLPLQPTAEPQDANTVTSAQVNDWIDWHGVELPAMAEPLRVVGDINSTAKGSGARYNNGKAPLELIPLSIIAASFQHDARLSLTDRQVRALAALDALGMFQAREGGVYDVLRELGGQWEDCAKVFDYGRRKYAEWNWAKGMKWSVPIGCAARHLMAIIRGEETDPESGLPHVGHVYCNVVMLLTYASTFTEGDDRPAKGMLL